MALVDYLTLEETFSLTRHRVLRALLSVLLMEINAGRAFEAAIVSDILGEINRRRVFDAAIVGDLLQTINELRAVMSPPLAALSEADLAAKTPQQVTADDMTAKPRTQLTLAQILATIKESIL